MSDSNYPVIDFCDSNPLHDWYHDGLGNYYSVQKLIDEAAELPVFEMLIAGIDLSYVIWKDANMFELANHCLKVNNADLSKPIILDWNGSVADGRHRIIKALTEGKTIIPCIRLIHQMNPDKVVEL